MASEDDYVLGRNLADSVRLNAQHLLWKLHTGYELHPDIPVNDEFKIAELGTGTGVWLFDLAKQLPASVQIHGYDISNSQFPPKDLWPPNVTMEHLNSLTDPPQSLSGQYDVIHLRMWTSNLEKGEISSLINHAKSLLKPGGFIQWEDADLLHQRVEGASAQEFENPMEELFLSAGVDHSWVPELPNLLRECEFRILQSDFGHFRDYQVQLCTDTYLLALREILQGIRRRITHDLLPSVSEQEVALDQLFSQKNTERIIYNWSPVSVLAQKVG